MARDRYRTGGSYTGRWEFSRKLDSSLQYIVECVYMIFQCNFNNKASQADRMDWTPGRIDDISIRNQWTNTNSNAVALRLPIQYRPYAKVFSRETQHSLLEHGPHDMEINLELGKEAPAGSLYPLSKDELDLLREYLEEMIRTGKICPGSGAAGVPIFFAKQSSGKL